MLSRHALAALGLVAWTASALAQEVHCGYCLSDCADGAPATNDLIGRESAVRELARNPNIDAVHAMAGPFYERGMTAMPEADEPHRVPGGCRKIVRVDGSHSTSVVAFILDQDTATRANVCDHVVTVREVEQRSGPDLLHGLNEQDQDQIETGAAILAGSLGRSP